MQNVMSFLRLFKQPATHHAQHMPGSVVDVGKMVLTGVLGNTNPGTSASTAHI